MGSAARGSSKVKSDSKLTAPLDFSIYFYPHNSLFFLSITFLSWDARSHYGGVRKGASRVASSSAWVTDCCSALVAEEARAVGDWLWWSGSGHWGMAEQEEEEGAGRQRGWGWQDLAVWPLALGELLKGPWTLFSLWLGLAAEGSDVHRDLWGGHGEGKNWLPTHRRASSLGITLLFFFSSVFAACKNNWLSDLVSNTSSNYYKTLTCNK